MSAAKASTKKTSARAKASSAARKVATGAAKGAAKSAARSATAASSKAVAAGTDRIGRGTRWTEEQVKLLLDTVNASGTAKEAFDVVARELGKNAGTVAQKYYNLQKAAGGGPRKGTTRRGRPAGSGSARAASSAASAGAMPSASHLRGLTVDDLVGLAARVKTEIDRRREELDAAAKALKG